MEAIAIEEKTNIMGVKKTINMKKNGSSSKKEWLLTQEKALEFYTKMLRIRRFEEKAGQAYGMGLIGGFCHLYIGQEAVVVGLQDSLKQGDQTITTYRDHGHMIAANTPPYDVYAELMGRCDGVSRGKGGSMHMFDTANNFYGGHGIVGANVPIGTGLAFANKYRGNDNLCITYFGDGSANQGQVYEAFNMAALWKLPVLYVIENNEYAMGTSLARSSAVTNLYKRGESFGIPGRQVDGMDVVAVKQAGLEAVEYIRSGNGPLLLEMKTYRYRGHSMSDPAKYRTKTELNDYKENKDAINALAQYIYQENFATEEELKQIDKTIKKEMAEAMAEAQKSPLPDANELYTDVYK